MCVCVLHGGRGDGGWWGGEVKWEELSGVSHYLYHQHVQNPASRSHSSYCRCNLDKKSSIVQEESLQPTQHFVHPITV